MLRLLRGLGNPYALSDSQQKRMERVTMIIVLAVVVLALPMGAVVVLALPMGALLVASLA
jgi:hypothetical protein